VKAIGKADPAKACPEALVSPTAVASGGTADPATEQPVRAEVAIPRPPAPSPVGELRLGKETITKEDLARLEESSLLNDSLMNFFICLVKDYLLPDAPPAEHTHVFNTRFFTQLTGRGAASGEEGWENVRTWTKRVSSVLGHRCLLVPINDATPACHWWLAAVALPRAGGSQPGRIFLLDSLPPLAAAPEREEAHSRAVRFLRGYVAREDEEERRKAGGEANEKPGACSRRPGPSLRRLPCEVSEAPLQENGSDCGVFVLELCAEFLSRGAEDGLACLGRKGSDGPRGWFGQRKATWRRKVLRDISSALWVEAEKQSHAGVAELLGGPCKQTPLLKQLLCMWSSAPPAEGDPA